MDKIKTIIIDIREEFELLETQIKSTDPSLLVMNIPMRAIFANKNWINEISKTNTFYLVCRSGNRTQKVKDRYFKNNNNVKSTDGGIKKLETNPLFKNKIQIIKGNGGLGLQQYLQLVFVCMLSLLLLLLYLGVDKKYIMVLIGGFILFILYQIYTKGCLISSFVPLSEFTKN